MTGRLQRLRTRLPRGFVLWAFACLLFAALLTNALIHFARLPGQVTRYANTHQQRVIIDPATGTVSGLAAQGSGAAAAFDVGPDEQAMDKQKNAQPPAVDEAKPESTPEPESVDQGPAGLTALRGSPETSDWPVIPRAGDSLVNAPAPEVTEKAGAIQLPKRAEHASPAQVYARGFTAGSAKHAVAIVIVDAGFSPDSLKAVLGLPKEVSVALSPYAPDTVKQITALHNAGHEVWSMLPAMGGNYPEDDPGPLGLLTTLSPDQTLSRMQNVMSVTLGSVGFVLPVNEAVSPEPKVWQTVLDEANRRGLLVLQARPGEPSKAPQQLQRADLILDSTPSAAFIKEKLNLLSDSADDGPHYIVIASARPQTLAMLKDYLANLPSALTLVPLSALYVAEPVKTEAKPDAKAESKPETKDAAPPADAKKQ